MKKCTKCKEHKSKTLFGKRKEALDNLTSQCVSCRQDATRKWKKTKLGIISVIYSNQKIHSKTRGHRPPEYTKQELKEWLFSQPKFHEIYSEWVNSNYKRRLTPSVDRKHDDIHYCFSNIQIITWYANMQKVNVGTFLHGYDKRRGKKCN